MRRKVIFKFILGLLTLSIGFLSNTSGSEFASLSAEDILDGIRMRAELLKSVHVTFNLEVYADHNVNRNKFFQNMPLVRYSEVDMKRLDKKMRVEANIYNLEDNQIDRIELVAWDGRKATGYARWPRDPDNSPSGSIKPAKRGPFKTCYWLTPLEQEVFDIRRPLSEILDEAEWTLAGLENIGQYPAYKLQGTGLWDNRANLQIWIDPTKDFAPVQLILTILFEDGINIVEKMSDVRLEQKDRVWVIAEAVSTLENPRHKDPRKRNFATKFSIKDYYVDTQLPDQTFQIDFPKGTWVYDEIIKMGYIAGEGFWVTDSDGLTHFVKADSLDNIDVPIEDNVQSFYDKTATTLTSGTVSSYDQHGVYQDKGPIPKVPVESKENISNLNWWLIFMTILTIGFISIVGRHILLTQRKRRNETDK